MEAGVKPIELGVGRQLLFDDHLIAASELERVFHQPKVHPATPVLKPETPIEMNGGYCPVACTFQDGVFFDPEDQLFKMTYHAGWFASTALATSKDGIHWDRPVLDVDGVTNRILPIGYPRMRDGAGFWLDTFAKDRSERFKMMVYYRHGSHPSMPYTDYDFDGVKEQYAEVYTSPDAIHWTQRGRAGECGDNSNFYFNPFDGKWYYSLRVHGERGRQRCYVAHEDFVEGRAWAKEDRKNLVVPDEIDHANPLGELPSEIYNFDAVAYEGVMLGIYGMFRGPQNPDSFYRGLPKITDLEIGFSRDGLDWIRPNRGKPFLAPSQRPGQWDRGYLHATGGVCLVVGDELYFYVSGFSGHSPMLGTHAYAGGSVGLVTLRRDGFVSLHAKEAGEMTTKPLVFSGGHFFVNADCGTGRMRVAVLDEEGRAISGYGKEDCHAVTVDKVTQSLSWKGGDLTAFAGRPLRFRFFLENAHLYSFWVSRSVAGQSGGYLAAGGPGYSGVIDE